MHLYALFGTVGYIVLAYLFSTNRKAIQWKSIGVGYIIFLVLGAIVFLWSFSRQILTWMSQLVNTFLSASYEGAHFLFGRLAIPPGKEGSLGSIIAFQVLPAVVFFSVLTALLYHFRILPYIIEKLANLTYRRFQLSGCEALVACSNIFVGVESILMVRPYLSRLTESELFLVLTVGMSTIASTVLAFYVSFLQDIFPNIAGHLISASILSIPASALIAKVLVPETGEPVTREHVPGLESVAEDEHWMASIIRGAQDGVRLAVGIGALLIGILGLVAVIDGGIRGGSSWIGTTLFHRSWSLTLSHILKVVAYPFVVLLGLPYQDWSIAGQLLGERWILTEVVAYQHLAEYARAGVLSSRTLVVLSYALCGFTHVTSVAIFAGGLSALVPERRNDIGKLTWRALFGATLATCMTGAVAALFFTGQKGILGF